MLDKINIFLQTLNSEDGVHNNTILSYKYDKQYSKDSHIANVLEKFIIDSKDIVTDLKPAINLLKNWDLSGEEDNREAALGFLTFRHIGFNPEEYTYDYDKIV